MQSDFVPQVKEFTSPADSQVGSWQVHKGDMLRMVERGDGLWNVLINGTRISFAIVPSDINKLAGTRLVEA